MWEEAPAGPWLTAAVGVMTEHQAVPGIHNSRVIERQGACQHSAAPLVHGCNGLVGGADTPSTLPFVCSCSMSVVSADQATFLVMGAVGSSHEATTIPNTVTVVRGSASSVEMIVNGNIQSLQQKPPTGRSDDSVSCDSSNQALQWAQEDGVPPPSDWVALQCAGMWRVCACWRLCTRNMQATISTERASKQDSSKA